MSIDDCKKLSGESSLLERERVQKEYRLALQEWIRINLEGLGVCVEARRFVRAYCLGNEAKERERRIVEVGRRFYAVVFAPEIITPHFDFIVGLNVYPRAILEQKRSKIVAERAAIMDVNVVIESQVLLAPGAAVGAPIGLADACENTKKIEAAAYARRKAVLDFQKEQECYGRR